MCARVRVVSYSDESLKGARRPLLRGASTALLRLSACIRCALLVYFHRWHCAFLFAFSIFNIEDDPRISRSRDRNSEDDLHSRALGPTGAVDRTLVERLYTLVWGSPPSWILSYHIWVYTICDRLREKEQFPAKVDFAIITPKVGGVNFGIHGLQIRQ